MPAENHASYKEELERLEFTLGYVENTLENMAQKKEKIDKELERVKRHYSSESSQDYIDLMINSTLQSSTELKLRNLKTARSKPYFARVDFKEKGSSETEKLYIGKMALLKDEDQQTVIVDWRAPISNLYYEGRIGESSYQCPGGIIDGELSLKRQFSIDQGRLNQIFDIDITTNDEFLQSYLCASADNRLKEIVSTIQVEQNKVIRSDMWTPLIVQGVAGSGKTTIALHRIAYLIYTFEKTFTPENFMIIAPNRLFLNYISEVLPELGVEKVKQTTFEDFSLELIGKSLKIKDGNEKLIQFVNHNAMQEQIDKNKLIRTQAEFKTSMKFKEVLDEFIESIEKVFIPEEGIKIDNWTIFKSDEIKKLFLNEYKKLPILKRIDEIRKHINNRVKSKKEYIINQFQSECDKRILQIKMTMEESEERRKQIIRILDNKDYVVDRIEKLAKSSVKEYFDKISKINAYQYYKNFFENSNMYLELMKNKVEDNSASFMREYTKSVLDSGFVDIEDLAPVIYLKLKIHGMEEKIPVKHIVIDEAQDFSVFQLYVLKNIIKDSSFTILGDLCQGIHSYRGTRNWSELKEYVFTQKCELLVLEQSYRTTVEIMNAANKVIANINDENITPGKPVIRHGEEPQIIEKSDMSAIAEDIAKNIVQFEKEGHKSIAVICKTMSECEKIQSLLKKQKIDMPHIITGKEKEYKSGIVIVPSYLSKGLEFDVVIIANANEDNYKKEDLDIKLLYVSMTRPLHKIIIYYFGRLTPLLNSVNK